MLAVLWFALLAAAGDTVVVGGGTCVEQAAVDAGVAWRVPAGRAGRVDVDVVDGEPGDGTVAAVVTFVDGAQRRLKADDCAQLTEQIAFVIALWRDPSLVLRASPPRAPVPLPAPTSTAVPIPEPTPTPTSTVTAPAPPRAALREPWRVAVAGGASSLLAGPLVSVQLRTGGALWVAGGARFEFSPPQQHGPAVLSLWAPSLTLDGCASWSVAWACVGVDGGALVAVPHDGLVSPQIGVVPLSTAGVAVGAALPFTASSALFLELGARVPLVPLVVAAGPTSLWSSSTVAAHANAGVMFDLP